MYTHPSPEQKLTEDLKRAEVDVARMAVVAKTGDIAAQARYQSALRRLADLKSRQAFRAD